MAENTYQENIQAEYANLSYSEIASRLNVRFASERTGINSRPTDSELPSKAEIEKRRLLDKGDHWQGGKAYIGQLPTGEGAAERTALLEQAFTHNNIVKEVLDTHLENVLGSDPQISFEQPQASEAVLEELLQIALNWLDSHNGMQSLEKALRGSLLAEAHVLRAFIPSGLLNGEGRIQAASVQEALDKIWIRAESIENGGVLVDETSATELGAFTYRTKINKQVVSLAEFSYLDQNRQTVWGTTSAHAGGVGGETLEPIDLGGLLTIYQLNSVPFVTKSIGQLQQQANLTTTMLGRNNNLAGSRERMFLNVQPPGYYVERGTDADGNVIKEFVPQPISTGPGTANFVNATPIFEGDKITAYANPNVIFTDPVPIDTFVGSHDFFYRLILSGCKMRHLLMADNATASGRSRIEARKEFEASLRKSKRVVDAAGAWMIEVALRIAAHFAGTPGIYNDLKVKFESQISVAELTPEERAEIRADYEAGLIDLETALELGQYPEPQKIIERLKEQRQTLTVEQTGQVNLDNLLTA